MGAGLPGALRRPARSTRGRAAAGHAPNHPRLSGDARARAAATVRAGGRAMTSPRCDQRDHVDDHFAGRLAVARERQMRTHLADCADCRDRYQRHLALGRLDPRALGFEERMRRGLGLALAGLSGRAFGLTTAAFALALGAWLLFPRLPALLHPGPDGSDEGFH